MLRFEALVVVFTVVILTTVLKLGLQLPFNTLTVCGCDRVHDISVQTFHIAPIGIFLSLVYFRFYRARHVVQTAVLLS